jgi:outer membrane receptor protein involved in Fe transport
MRTLPCRSYAAPLQRTLVLALFACVVPSATRAADTATPAAKKTTATTPAGSTSSSDQVVELNPFEVRAEQDDSYNALESNSVTRFRVELYKLPVTAEVFTETFMRDIAATTVEDMIVNYGGASVTSQDGANASLNNQPGDRVGSIGTPTTVNIRGLPASIHRDGFISAAPTTYGQSGLTDNFSVERVDVTSGAHSLLYGNSGGGGVINMVSKQARFHRTFGRTSYRIDQFGSSRLNVDLGVGGDKVAARIATTTAETKYRRLFLGGSTNGVYGQLAFKLPFNSILRLSNQNTNSFQVTSSGNGNINNFLYKKDASGNIILTNGLPTIDTAEPRRNLNLNYLTASGQVSDLKYIYGPGFDLNNVDSFRGWMSSNWNRDSYSNIQLETTINSWLSSQFAIAYDDAVFDAPVNATSLTPAAGLPSAGNNPFNQTAIALNSPGDSVAHTRVFGGRWSFLASNEFFHGKARSQTLVGGEYTRRDGAQNGVQYRYYLLNPDGTLFVNPNALTNGEYGRTLLANSPTLWTPVQNGPVATPFFKAMTPTIQAINPATGQMASWSRQQQRKLDPALVSPTNPLGADRTGNGEYNVGHTVSHAYNIANVTDWFDGKLETLGGARWVSQMSTNVGPTAMTVLPKVDKVTYSAGISYQLLSWLRPFADVSSAFNPSAQPNDPIGTPTQPPSGAALTPDFGLKFRLLGGRADGSITWVPNNTLKNDRINIDGTYQNAINPAGINGRYLGIGGLSQATVNTDKKSTDLDVSIALALKRNWRTRFAFHMIDGSYGKTVKYAQLYNDQFFVNSAGQVTYGAGGSPVLVNTTTGAVVQTGGSPLTLAMINDPASPLTANPNSDSGSIQNTTLKNALKAVGPTGATAATGVTGLPITAIQYTWDDPNKHQGIITPIIGGDKTNGYSHYTFSFTNVYNIDRGWLKGLGLITTANASYQYRSHYYPVFAAGQIPGTTPFNQLQRKLYVRPTIATFDLGFSYTRKIFHGFTWSTQVNVQNAFNHTRLLFPPSTSGSPAFNNYVRTNEPRLWIWTNSIAF